VAIPSSRDVKLWLALLHELDLAGGTATPRALYPKMLAYFPDFTSADLVQRDKTGSNTWQNRIQWARQHLVDRGFIDRSQHAMWTLSPSGRQWLTSHWRGTDADYGKVAKPATVTKSMSSPAAKPKPDPHQTRPSGSAKQVPLELPQVGPITLLDPVEELCQRLQRSQRQSNSPQTFEEDLVTAFAMLGFVARHIGGSGDTDILCRLRSATTPIVP
jgi:restriction endonuclease Mrr